MCVIPLQPDKRAYSCQAVKDGGAPLQQQRNGTINKTKQNHTRKTKRRNQPRKERKKGKVGEAIIIEKKSDALLAGLEFLSSYPVLGPIMKTPRGDGVGEEGPETRSWRNTQRKRRFFLLVLSVKMLQSCVQSIPSLTGCWRERRGAADVTGPRRCLHGPPVNSDFRLFI